MAGNNKPVLVDCRDCRHSGQNGDHMIFCHKIGHYRAWGKRICWMFEKKPVVCQKR